MFGRIIYRGLIGLGMLRLAASATATALYYAPTARRCHASSLDGAFNSGVEVARGKRTGLDALNFMRA